MSKSSSTRRLQEKTVQNFLEWFFITKGFEVKREVKTPVGYIDIILYQTSQEWHRRGRKILIEVKEVKGIKGAIGQLYSYEKYHSDCTEKWVIYFSRDGKDRAIDSSYYSNTNIRFNSVHSIADLETIEKFDRSKKPLGSDKSNKEEVVSYGELWLSEESQNKQESLELPEEMILTSFPDLEKMMSSF